VIALITAGAFFILSIVILFLGYDWNKQTYKSGPSTALVFVCMFVVACSILVFKNHQQFSTSQFYVEKTIKTEIVNNVIVKSDTLIRIKFNNKK